MATCLNNCVEETWQDFRIFSNFGNFRFEKKGIFDRMLVFGKKFPSSKNSPHKLLLFCYVNLKYSILFL
jgi:hypothetical protein